MIDGHDFLLDAAYFVRPLKKRSAMPSSRKNDFDPTDDERCPVRVFA